MIRFRPVGITVLAMALLVLAEDKAVSRAGQVKELVGKWQGPPVEAELLNGKKVKGRFSLVVREGGRLSLIFRSETGTGATGFDYSVRERDKKRYLVIDGLLGKPGEMEIQFELSGDTLKLTAPKKVIVNPLAQPAEMSGEWKRVTEEKR